MICLEQLTTVHYCNCMAWYQVISAWLFKVSGNKYCRQKVSGSINFKIGTLNCMAQIFGHYPVKRLWLDITSCSCSNAQWSVGLNKSCCSSGLTQYLWTLFQVFQRVKWMLSAEIISALFKWSYWIKPILNSLYYFIVGALDGKESSCLKG